jgi:hypothetical protein
MPYVANKDNLAPLTNIHYWDSAAGAWSGNLLGAATPFTFLPNPTVVGDLVLFGIDSTVLNAGPFCSLVFDLATAQTGITVIDWFYSDAAGADPTTWGALTVQDNTNADGAMTGVAFDTTGVSSVHWKQPAAWIVQNPTIGGVALGVTGLWVCAANFTVPGAATPPVQQNRDVYTVTWSGIETEEVGGDMDALAEVVLNNEAYGPPLLAVDQLFIGSRLVSRGADFIPFLTASTVQQPTGWNLSPGGASAEVVDVRSTVGTVVQTNFPGAPAWESIGLGGMTADRANQTRGTFRVFFRTRQVGGAAGDVEMRFDWRSLDIFKTSRIVATAGTGTRLMDFGTWTFPFAEMKASETQDTEFVFVEARNIGAATTFELIEMIFLPVDEMALEVYLGPDGTYEWRRRYDLHLDGLTYPRHEFRSYLTDAPSWGSDVQSSWDYTGRRIVMEENNIQRHYIVTNNEFTGTTCRIENCLSVRSWTAAQRYSSMRGAR